MQNQHSKHHNRIERLPAGTTLPHLLRCQRHSLDVGAKRLPWLDYFERIALRRQCRQPLSRIIAVTSEIRTGQRQELFFEEPSILTLFSKTRPTRAVLRDSKSARSLPTSCRC